MQLGELEKAMKRVMRTDPMQPALAGLLGNGPGNVHLSAEFDAAAKSLAKRIQQQDIRGVARQRPTYDWM